MSEHNRHFSLAEVKYTAFRILKLQNVLTICNLNSIEILVIIIMGPLCIILIAKPSFSLKYYIKKSMCIMKIDLEVEALESGYQRVSAKHTTNH